MIPTDCRWRVHTQAHWPRIYNNLTDVIAFLIKRQPLWFVLEYEAEDAVWKHINTLDESLAARYADFMEDRSA